MKNKRNFVIMLLAVVMVLAACGGATEQTDSTDVTDETDTSGTVKTLYVGTELVDCVGEGPQTCMLVKENPDDEYQLFYNQIQGFTFEEGYEYELKVQVDTVENPPAGGSSLQYTLVEVVSQTPVTAETDTTADDMENGEVKTLYVGPELVECTGVAPQMCMQVKDSPDGEYQFFYDQIEGFTFEPGYEYELKVMVETVENPPADGSSLKYTLVEEVSKTAVNAETTPDTSTETASSLTGSLWTLTAYADANGAMQDVLPDTEVTAVFGEDGSLSGNAGCNSYNTSYQVDGSSLTINEMIATTMMMCPEPVMQQETVYLANLAEVAAYEISGDSLTLANAEGNAVAVFTVQQATPLTGTEWQVVMYNNGKEAVVGVLEGSNITAVFGEDGMVSGNASCNTYNASYQLDGNNITIGMGMTTMMACMEPEGVMEQETAYLAALTSAAVYSVQGNVLELRTADGALAVSYQAAEPVDLSAMPWVVTSYNNGRGGAVSPLLDTELTIVVQEDGNVTGSSGCNRYFGTFTTDGDAVTVGPLATTRAFCPEPEGIMEQEQEFLAALQAAATFSIRNGILDIRMADGAIAVMAVQETAMP